VSRDTENSDRYYNRKRHLGVDFVIWSRAGAWYWLLTNPYSKRDMIGASVNERRATNDAHCSIEEVLAAARSRYRGKNSRLKDFQSAREVENYKEHPID
jgi:hypothetical protein